MWIMKAENKTSERRKKMKLQEGFTLIELVIATAIIGIVVAVAVPQYTAYKKRAYDANVQANLRSVFTMCQEFWTFNSSNSPCLLTTVSNNEYRLIVPADVEITIDSNANNTEYNFYATASHTSSSNIFVIDHRGVVSKSNSGRGCSEIAQNDPHNLGKNAKGGCGTAGGNNGKNNS